MVKQPAAVSIFCSFCPVPCSLTGALRVQVGAGFVFASCLHFRTAVAACLCKRGSSDYPDCLFFFHLSASTGDEGVVNVMVHRWSTTYTASTGGAGSEWNMISTFASFAARHCLAHMITPPRGCLAFFLLNESTPQHREWFNELIETYVKWTSSSLTET